MMDSSSGAIIPTSGLPDLPEYVGISEEEFHKNLRKWRRPTADFETLVISETVDPGTFCKNCLVVPIVTSSVFVLHGPADEVVTSGFHYGRCGNPTRNAFENCMAQLDGAKYALSFSAGVAGVAAIVQTMKQDDHVIYVQITNGDSDWLFRNKWKDFGIQVHFIYSSARESILQVIRENTKDNQCERQLSADEELKNAKIRDFNIDPTNVTTKMIWLESPANPTLDIVDIGGIAEAVHRVRSDIIIVVDNTFLTPVMQRPLELGADVVVYSCTKYLCGHADVTMGAVTTNNQELYKKMQDNQICMGGIPSPFDCYLMLRSFKTLPMRMEKHFTNAMKIAHFLESHPCVQKVRHPGLKSHPHHQLALKQQFGHSGMVGFFIKGELKEAAAFLDSLQVFKKAPSLGSDVSIASIPAKASHSWLPEEERLKLGITEDYVRLSVGLESAKSLIQDLDQALRRAVPIWI